MGKDCAPERLWLINDYKRMDLSGEPWQKGMLFVRNSLLLAAICLTSCDTGGYGRQHLRGKHDLIVERAVQKVPLFTEFKSAFPQSSHFITYITGSEGTPIWNSKSDLFARYELTLRVEVSIEANEPYQVTLAGDPKFYLIEITNVETLSDGRKQTLHSASA